MEHINQTPLIITGNGTTHVETTYTLPLQNATVVSVCNTSTTVNCYVSSGASPVATTSMQIIPFGKTRSFIKNEGDKTISIVFAGASTDKVHVTVGEDTVN